MIPWILASGILLVPEISLSQEIDSPEPDLSPQEEASLVRRHQPAALPQPERCHQNATAPGWNLCGMKSRWPDGTISRQESGTHGIFLLLCPEPGAREGILLLSAPPEISRTAYLHHPHRQTKRLTLELAEFHGTTEIVNRQEAVSWLRALDTPEFGVQLGTDQDPTEIRIRQRIPWPGFPAICPGKLAVPAEVPVPENP